MENGDLGKTLSEIFDGQNKYIVPLYQRNFAWRRPEIEQLLQDVYETYIKTNGEGNYFIGSLVVLKRSNGDFEVIDGQQRLTTLSLITKMLGINKEPRLFYDSRPEVEEFFDEFYKSEDNSCHLDYPQIFYLKNAIDYIKDVDLDATGKDNCKIADVEEKFKYYFANKVFLVRVEIPQDTDVAAYFEIMNNRGEQLQKHEILKSFLIAKIDNEIGRKEFAYLWDVCSQMNIPIQRLFNNVDLRKRYFGDTYEDFICPFENVADSPNITTPGYYSIKDILQRRTNNINNVQDNDKNIKEIDEDASKYNSIIDFPNFLMHILKLKYQTEQIDIPLNEKYLLSVYDKIETDINSIEFIKTLFFCRVVFDRYIVKTITDKTVEGEIRWTLRKPTKSTDGLEYTNTFSNDNEQDRIKKALTMLQVSVSARTYKNWLYQILKWFYDKQTWSIDVTYKEYIKLLDEIILKEYKEISPNATIDDGSHLSKTNSYSQGTKTPRFLFNFIDYLYWVDSQSATPINKSYKIEDFDFKYWNSVEHHLAQQYAKEIDKDCYTDYIDNLGNLCLISKDANSRLSDRSVQEKCERSKENKKGPNRQIMYKETKNSDDTYTWNKDKIKQHYNELLTLLSNRENILKTEQGE